MNLTVGVLKLLCERFCSRYETRLVINYVRIEPIGETNVALATDGRRMAMLDLGGPPLPQAVHFWREDAVKLYGQYVEFDIEGDRTLVRCMENMDGKPEETVRFYAKECPMTFPEWRKTVPKRRGNQRGFVNADYLKDFRDLARAFKGFAHDGWETHVYTFAEDDKSAHSVFCYGGFLGLLMPIYYPHNESDIRLPTWLKSKHEEAAK